MPSIGITTTSSALAHTGASIAKRAIEADNEPEQGDS